MGEFPNKATQFSSENQPAKNGNIKGNISSKTILNKFLSIEMEQKNPFTKELERLTVKELMHLVQIKKALDGELASYKELLDRDEGKVQSTLDVTSNNERVSIPLIEWVKSVKKDK